MNSLAFTRYELLRLVRNRRAFIFSLIFPLILSLVIGTSAQGDAYGVPYKEYYMVAMIAFGATMAVLSGGARIAADRAAGWMRALRLTPLSVGAYLRAKMLSGLFLALISVVLISAASLATGVRMGWGPWIETVALVIVGLVPLGFIGIALGHLGSPESMGPHRGRPVRAAGDAGRLVVPPDGDARGGRQAAADVLDHPRRPAGHPGARLAGDGVDRGGRVDRGRGRARRVGLPALGGAPVGGNVGSWPSRRHARRGRR